MATGEEETAGEGKGEEEDQRHEERTADEQKVVDRLLKEFADVFPAELPAGLPPDRGSRIAST